MLSIYPTKNFMVCAMCAGLGLSFYTLAADRNVLAIVQKVDKEIDANAQKEGLNKTLELNFSPEKRENLRKALDDYARSIDQDHALIEVKRREMQESVKERFFDADVDFDNTIDRQEATEKLPQIARHFNSVDADHDGLISLDELEAAQLRILERRKDVENALQLRKILENESSALDNKNSSKQSANTAHKSAI